MNIAKNNLFAISERENHGQCDISEHRYWQYKEQSGNFKLPIVSRYQEIIIGK